MINLNFLKSSRGDLRHGAALTLGAALLAGAAAFIPSLSLSAESAVKVPAPAHDESASGGTETIVLAGGCFWGVQGVFQHVTGVTDAVSGYAGGTKVKPSYEEVSSGTTGHAESVRVTFDPKVVSLGSILQIYFSVAHNPTELNYQGPDEGTQYRSEIFYQTDNQKEVATAYIAELGRAKTFSGPIVTRVEKLAAFYPAEDYHQNYATLHPDAPYIAYNDLPKIDNLKAMFADRYRGTPKLVDLNAALN
jgi:peptide-methionine (S)-S-oxide reductase